jgi:hypothetical protein
MQARARGEAFAVAVTALLFLVVTLSQARKPFYGDSADYWQLGLTFVTHGQFSLLNFDSSLRGYLFPLVMYGLRKVADGSSVHASFVVKVFNTAVFTSIGAVLVPRLVELTWPQRRWGFSRRIALAILLAVLWGGYLAFPLTDFPDLALVLLALLAVSRPDSPRWMCVAGLACGAAIDLRPAYILLAPALVVLVAMAWWESRRAPGPSWRRRSLIAALAVAGVVLVSLPQSLTEHRHFGSWSPIPGAKSNLTEIQFTYGTQLQRYDTYVGRGHGMQMLYLDTTGLRLIAEHGGAVKNLGQYIDLLTGHPIEMLSLYERHFLNGIDQRYNTPYVERIAGDTLSLLRVVSLLLLFTALTRLLWPAARRSLGPARWRYPVALVLSGGSGITSATESRFMLPAVVVIYMLALTPGWPNPLASGGPAGSVSPTPRRLLTPALLLLGLGVFAALVLPVVQDATHDLRLA